MKERWKTFQDAKKAAKKIKVVKPKVKKGYSGEFIGYDWAM